jgi:hypothetical protein
MTYFNAFVKDDSEGDHVTALYGTGRYGKDFYAPFDPLTLSPTIWLDGNDESTITKSVSDEISQWDDKSGNGNDATQGTVIQQPIFTTSAIGSNSSPDFDGSNDKMVTTLNWPLQFHIFVVMRPTNTSGVRVIMSSYDGSGGLSSQGEYILDHRNGSLVFQAFNTSPPLSTAGISANNTYLVEVSSDASKNLEMYLNNVLVDDGTHGTSAATRAINIGFNEPSSGSTFFRGYIGEIFLFPSVLSAGNKSKLISYFDAKYPGIGL